MMGPRSFKLGAHTMGVHGSLLPNNPPLHPARTPSGRDDGPTLAAGHGQPHTRRGARIQSGSCNRREGREGGLVARVAG